MIPTSEADLLQAVRDLAAWTGWLTYHTHRSDRSEPGFPDLVLVRDGVVIFAELKSDTGRMSGPQGDWMVALLVAEQRNEHVLYRVWRPRDWSDIESTLNAPRRRR